MKFRLRVNYSLTAFTVGILILAGCKSADAPGSSSLAAVTIQGSDVASIQQETIRVFQQKGYNVRHSDEAALTFDREATKRETRWYGSWMDDSPMWIRVDVQIQPHGGAYLLRCDAQAVRDQSAAFFDQKLRPISAGPYKDLLEQVRNNLALHRGTTKAVTD